MPENITLAPQPGPQTDFLKSSADICIFGGAAFGGKSFGLELEPLYDINTPGFGAVIFRKTMKQVKNKGGLWDTSKLIYGKIPGARPIESKYKWQFPVAEVQFAHLENPGDMYAWDGSQIPLLCFDELQHFSLVEFRYLLSRNRTTCGAVPRCRCTCNPDPDSWILQLINWFIGEDGYPIPERCGKKVFFATYQDKFVTTTTEEEMFTQYHFQRLDDEGKPTRFKTVTFIPSTYKDNPIGMQADPDYVLNLDLQAEHEKARLKLGNWKFKKQGKLFKREWFKWISRADYEKLTMQAATVGVDPSGGSGKGHDAQGIVGDAKGRDGFFYVVEDATCSLSPLGWAKVASETYHEMKAGKIVAETNYGGDMVISNIAAVDTHANVVKVVASRGKAVRAEPLASLYEKGLVFHVGAKPELENEMIGFDPEDKSAPSPNRMDAHVWAMIDLMGGAAGWLEFARQDLERMKAKEAEEKANAGRRQN